MDENRYYDSSKNNTPETSFEGEAFDGMSTRPRRGAVNKVCRDWLVREDGALAHQLQSQEIAAYYGCNRERNRLLRQDAPQARMVQEDELQQALAWEKHQRELREKQVKEDEEAARRLAKELSKEKSAFDKLSDREVSSGSLVSEDYHNFAESNIEQVCSSIRSIDLHQPMSEEEAREWQELCDSELAKKLQQQEEEESRYRRDISDLSWRLEMEAKDRELARALYEKDKERLKRAKERARLKAKHKPIADPSIKHHGTLTASSTVTNVAYCIDPTWNGQSNNLSSNPKERTSFPVTDLDFPVQSQSGTRGKLQDRVTSKSPSADEVMPGRDRAKSSVGCSHQ